MQDRFVGTREPQRPEDVQRRPLQGRNHGLLDAQVGQGAHLVQPLQRGRPGVGNGAVVGLRGEVAGGEPAVMVRRADEPVEVPLLDVVVRKTHPKW